MKPLPPHLYMLRVADTEGNQEHTYWKTFIGSFVYWKAAEMDIGPSFASWDATEDIAQAQIFTTRRELDKAQKSIDNFDTEIVAYVAYKVC